MFFLIFENVCESYSVLKVIYFVKQILRLVLMLIPFVLIVMMALDFVKALVSSAGDMDRNASMVIKRVIACICLFLVPTFVNITMSLLENRGVYFSSCYTNADEKVFKALESDEVDSVKAVTYKGTQVYKSNLVTNTATVVPGNKSGTGNGTVSNVTTGKGMGGRATKISIKYNASDKKGRCGKSPCAAIATVKYPNGTVKYYMGAQGQVGVNAGASCRINAFMCGRNAVVDGKNSSADLYRYLQSEGYSGKHANLSRKTIPIAAKKYGVSNLIKVYHKEDITKEDAKEVIASALDNGQPVMIFVGHSSCSDLAGSEHALLLLGYDKNEKIVFVDSGNKVHNSNYKKRTVKQMSQCISNTRGYFRMIVFSFK